MPNFKERFEAFPVEVDVLSRFRSRAEQKETLEKLKKGQVDILIGTHRLLSKDVEFADLGLIVIDEEQRFGVKHKETLKELKKKVDVLTLTATPIPRTLHMSMLGIRDLSVIENPTDQSLSRPNLCPRNQSNHYPRCHSSGDGSGRAGLLSLQQSRHH
mgnify:CR=1 FL=1